MTAVMIDDPMLATPLTIRGKRRETDDTFTLDLAPPDAGVFAFTAGQFNMLYVFGVGEIPISISGNPIKPDVLVHTTRAVGTVSKAMCALKRGDTIGVRGPFGNGWPVETAVGKDIIIVAGGIGLAPLRPVIYHVLAQRARFGHVTILYGTRTADDILYRKELERWGARLDVDVHVTVDRGSGGWRGNVGVVTTLIPRARLHAARSLAMLCGPEIMMRFTALELMKRGLRREQIHLSMERNMKCGVGFCGHCQYGPEFVCKDGPVFRYDRIERLFGKREV